jgi:acyl-CoA thioesterase I
MNKNGMKTQQKLPQSRGLITRRVALAAALLAGWGAANQAQSKNSKIVKHKILVVGDSLSAEYGLKRGTGWVALLAQRLAQSTVPTERSAQVVNASISGDTTSGGRARLAPLLQEHQPTLVILELGANDALRGLPLDVAHNNLRAMTQAAKAVGAQVVLAGMQLPPNYGRRYSEEFTTVFTAVAQSENAAVVPFFLKGVADGPQAEVMFQPDRIHPKEQAQPIMLDNMWAVLAPLLKR